MTAPTPTRAEEAREAGLRCACSKVPFPLSLEPGYEWRCPCGKSSMRSCAPLSAEARASRAEAEVARLKEEIGGWQRVAVIAAIPLEAMRMSGSYRALGPTAQTSVDEAVVTIRLAVSDKGLPPYGDIDVCLAPARAALHGGDQ